MGCRSAPYLLKVCRLRLQALSLPASQAPTAAQELPTTLYSNVLATQTLTPQQLHGATGLSLRNLMTFTPHPPSPRPWSRPLPRPAFHSPHIFLKDQPNQGNEDQAADVWGPELWAELRERAAGGAARPELKRRLREAAQRAVEARGNREVQAAVGWALLEACEVRQEGGRGRGGNGGWAKGRGDVVEWTWQGRAGVEVVAAVRAFWR